MSVNSYLADLSSTLVLSQDEQNKISTSIANLNSKLKSYFQKEISEQFKFGSMIRGTILPRKADEGSDVDYMIVFGSSTEKLKPQTYLNKLKTFVEKSYSSSAEAFADSYKTKKFKISANPPGFDKSRLCRYMA